jgi:hypothetical protein
VHKNPLLFLYVTVGFKIIRNLSKNSSISLLLAPQDNSQEYTFIFGNNFYLKRPTKRIMKENKNMITGVSLGVLFGTVLGAILDNIGLWLSIGIAIGTGVSTAFYEKTNNDSKDC